MIANSTQEHCGSKRKAEDIEPASENEVIGKLIFDVELSHKKLEEKKVIKEYSEIIEYKLSSTEASDNCFQIKVISPEGFSGTAINKYGGDSFIYHFLYISGTSATLKFLDKGNIRPCPRRTTFSLVEGVVTFKIKRDTIVKSSDLRHLKRLLNFLHGGELPNPSN